LINCKKRFLVLFDGERGGQCTPWKIIPFSPSLSYFGVCVDNVIYPFLFLVIAWWENSTPSPPGEEENLNVLIVPSHIYDK
jgi:hypothetical protein